MESVQQIASVAATSSAPDTNEQARQPAGNYPTSELPDLALGTAADIDAMLAASEKRLRRYFTGQPLERFLEINSSSTDTTTGYEITGGVDDFKVTSLSVSDGEADIEGTATIWVNGATIEPDATNIDYVSGAVTYKAHLVLLGNIWKVDDYSVADVTGSGP